MFKWALVFSTIVAASLAAESIGVLEERVKNEEGCYISDVDAVIPFGSSVPAKGQCMEYNCGETFIKCTSCGVVVAVPPFRIVNYPNQPYPDCCPHVVGPE